MSVYNFAELQRHVGHKIQVVTYGDPKDPANVAAECVRCGEVLLDYDAPADAPPARCPECKSEKTEWDGIDVYDCLTCGLFFAPDAALPI